MKRIDNTRSKVRDKILKYLEETGCTQRFLAKKAGINESYFCQLLNTNAKIGDATLLKLQYATGIQFFKE